MPRNPFGLYDDFEDTYAPAPRRNIFGGGSVGPETNTRNFMQPAFQQPPIETPAAGPPEPAGNDWGSWMNEMRDAYTKEGPAAASYREHLGAIPQYQTPSKWGRFGAALVGGAEGLTRGGAAGWRAGQEAAQAPYRRELEQWTLKGRGLGQQAENEEKMTGRKVQFLNTARQMAKDEEAKRQWGLEQEHKTQQEKNDEAFRQAQIRRWGTQDLETYTDEQGNLRERMPGTAGPGNLIGPSEKAADIANQDVMRQQGWANIGINRGQLGVSQGQLGVSQGQLDLGRTREARIEATPMSPQAQSSARSSAISRATTERSDWRGYVDPETGMANPPKTSDPNEWKKFQDFMRRVEAIEQGIFTRPQRTPEIVY